MHPAATLGSGTSHGTPLAPGPGSPNVLIGGKPAWRASTDFHSCPLVSVNPHVGGMVTIGSSTVIINNLPAVRQGDMIIESGSINTVIQGEPTVLIG